MSYPVTSKTSNLDTTEEIIQATLDIIDIRNNLERKSSMIIDVVAIVFILIAVGIRLISGDKNKPAIWFMFITGMIMFIPDIIRNITTSQVSKLQHNLIKGKYNTSDQKFIVERLNKRKS